MRISTNTVYQAGISKINTLQAEQVKLQLQISTGRKIDTPSDDPVGAAQALTLSYAQGINTKYADTRQTAQLKLNTLESNLNSVSDVLVSAQSSLIAAGNGAYSDQERSFLAGDLKSSLEMLIGLANQKDASGNYLYGGYQTATLPFVANAATGATYAGDNNQQRLQVDSQRQLAVSYSGSSVFQPTASSDVFKTLNDMINLLNTPITNAADQANFSTGLASAITNMGTSVDNVLNIRADVGAKLREIDVLDASGSDRDLQYTKALSDIQDLDYASALSDLAKKQTIMEAAQKSFVATTSLSLFKFI